MLRRRTRPDDSLMFISCPAKLSPYSAGPGFSDAALLDICTTAVLPFGPRPATPLAPAYRRPATAPKSSRSTADVNDDRLVAAAVSGAWAVVNAVSLYVEHGEDTFQSVHVQAAERTDQAKDHC